MAQLFVPLHGAFAKVAGTGVNAYGENLERPHWRGAELGMLETFPDVWGAVSEAEFREWIIGVHHPLYKQGGPAWCRFLDPDQAVRQQALQIASVAAQAAHHIGARYILYHFPWPGFNLSGSDHEAEGWSGAPRLSLDGWTEAAMYEASRRVFDHLAEVQAREQIRVIVEIDGPNPYFFDGEMYTRLFEEHPDLSLCVDTGRLGLLARSHGQHPLALLRRWLPWTRQLHLSSAGRDEHGRWRRHLPTNGNHTMANWPAVTPSADMARMVLEAQPRCTVVLEHDPAAVSPAELEEAHAWAAALVETQRGN